VNLEQLSEFADKLLNYESLPSKCSSCFQMPIIFYLCLKYNVDDINRVLQFFQSILADDTPLIVKAIANSISEIAIMVGQYKQLEIDTKKKKIKIYFDLLERFLDIDSDTVRTAVYEC